MLKAMLDFVGTVPQWITAIAAIFGFRLARSQLDAMRKANGATFIHDLYNDFVTNDVEGLIPALMRGDFEIVETVDRDDGMPKGRKKFDVHEICRCLLNPLESVGALASRKLIDIGLVYDFFYFYIHLVWNNEEIRNHIEQARIKLNDPDLFKRLQTLHYQCNVCHDRELLRLDKNEL